MLSFNLHKGDYGMDKNGTINQSDNTAFNLTNYGVDLRIWKDDPDNPVLKVSQTIVSPTAGTVRWTVTQAQSTTLGVGIYTCEYEITGSSYRESTNPFRLTVIRSPTT